MLDAAAIQALHAHGLLLKCSGRAARALSQWEPLPTNLAGLSSKQNLLVALLQM